MSCYRRNNTIFYYCDIKRGWRFYNTTITMKIENIIKFYGATKTPCKINKRELAIGSKIEKEHTKDKKIAKAIATAHICEFPKYYTGKHGLINMEKLMKKK